jgi:pilus assembly protein Flp/PilA
MLSLDHLGNRSKKMKTIAKFAKDESGATAIEYGLIAALIAVGIIAAATTLGGSISNTFSKVSGKMDAAVTAAP